MIKKRLTIQRFFMMICLVVLLTACGGTLTRTTSIDTHTTHESTAIGGFTEYALPQANSGLMRPVIDHHGHIWFGEMSRNFLASFDPDTQTFQQIIPPHGAYGVMGVAIASDDSVWFAEQFANYIGHYIPATKQFQVYDLPLLKAPDPSNAKNTLSLPSAPNDLALDRHGNVWFTELNAASLGMLDVRSARIKQYPLSTKRSIQTLIPYGVTVDPQGMIWFTESTTNAIGRLDPVTDDIRSFGPPDSIAPLMEIASDTHGLIWATSFRDNALVRFDPKTAAFSSYVAPTTNGGTNGLYGLVASANNEIWVTVPAENAIARLTNNTFTYYTIPTPASFPFGIVMGSDSTLWFTEAGSNKLARLTTS